MVERFLRYSIENKRKIALIIMENGVIKRISVYVRAIENNQILYASSPHGKEKFLSEESILSAAYGRGDDGDTLTNEENQKNA